MRRRLVTMMALMVGALVLGGLVLGSCWDDDAGADGGGDAVMAAFLVSGDAMESVLHMHEAFNNLEQARDDVIIKVGMHRGPCIAVSSNDRLDYFGRTVNIAAWVQGKSLGGDVVLSKSLAEEPDIRDRIAASPWHPEVFHAELKGIEDALEVVRLTRS